VWLGDKEATGWKPRTLWTSDRREAERDRREAERSGRRGGGIDDGGGSIDGRDSFASEAVGAEAVGAEGGAASASTESPPTTTSSPPPTTTTTPPPTFGYKDPPVAIDFHALNARTVHYLCGTLGHGSGVSAQLGLVLKNSSKIVRKVLIIATVVIRGDRDDAYVANGRYSSSNSSSSNSSTPPATATATKCRILRIRHPDARQRRRLLVLSVPCGDGSILGTYYYYYYYYYYYSCYYYYCYYYCYYCYYYYYYYCYYSCGVSSGRV
jgi:hypothetical protein